MQVFKPKIKGPTWEHWLAYGRPTRPRYPIFYGKRLQEARQFGRDYLDGVFMESCPASQSSGKTVAAPYRIGEITIMNLMMYINMKLLALLIFKWVM
jgi:hypothetical protein